MITLVANTITIIVPKANRLRHFVITSDSTTFTRLGKTKESVEMSTQGFSFTVANTLTVRVEAGEEIFAVSAGTPKIGISEVTITGALTLG